MYDIPNDDRDLGNALGMPTGNIETDETISVRSTFMNFTNSNKITFLKKDSQYIPVSCIDMNNDIMDKTILERKICEALPNKILNKVPEIKDTVSNLSSEISDIYNEAMAYNFSRNIIVQSFNVYESYSRDLVKQLLFSLKVNKYVNIRSRSNENIIMTFMYIFTNDRILLTLVVKKDRIKQFKKNYADGKIDPRDTEVWVDEEVYTRKNALYRLIQKEVLPYIVFRGFTVKVKSDILSELVYIPKFKPKSIRDLVKVKQNVNKILFEESNILKLN